MRIVNVMAIYATGLRLKVLMVPVASLAGCAGMHTLQWKLRQFVVKSLRLIPLVSRVASGTIPEFFISMYVIGDVAGATFGAETVAQGAAVALQAGQGFMLAEQGPVGIFTVVKPSQRPLIGVVATVTLPAMSPGVNVNTAVARYTFDRWRAFVQAVVMTSLAGLLPMGAPEFKFRLCRVIKLGAVPVRLRMAAVTALAIAAEVNISNAVATDAPCTLKSVLLTRVATATRHRLMPALQGEVCSAVIEILGPMPAFRTVTCTTFIAQGLAVRVLLLMAIMAFARRITIQLTFAVAGIAGYASMLSRQVEIRMLVIECIRIQGNTVVVPALVIVMTALAAGTRGQG
jgi:hypothetical protein